MHEFKYLAFALVALTLTVSIAAVITLDATHRQTPTHLQRQLDRETVSPPTKDPASGAVPPLAN